MTTVVILIAVTVMVAFCGSVQKMDFSGVKAAPDLKVSLLLNTPVFVMLALMGYAYVVLNAQISVDQEDGFMETLQAKRTRGPHRGMAAKCRMRSTTARSSATSG